ncbi:MAG: aminopeptidase P family protein [Acidobacteria bacterium]|nr:aminopeptidase P family protein [Acidobacteriota bacterium]
MLPDNEFQQRRARLLECFPTLQLDSFLVTHLPNVHYLTGFTGSNAMLLAAPGRDILFTDPRYTIQAAQETTCHVVTVRGPMLPKVVAAIARHKLQMLGLEAAYLPHLTHQFLREKLPLRHEFKLIAGQIEQHRMVKSASELARIERAVATNSKALDAVLKRIRPGLREMDLAAEIDYRSRREGASGPSFETIVASGVRAALPHARPTANPIEPNQLLLIDMGATREGYTSDMTRTLGIGKPSTFWKQTYRAVLESQLAAIEAIRPGVKASEPDRAARQVLEQHGLEKTFTHSTGHGLGLEIHEAPRLGRKEKTKLLEGMVVTVEPGVYLEGKGGIRIEDTVLVTRTGCRILTPTPKEWMVL